MDGLKTGKLGGALGGAGSVLPFFRLYEYWVTDLTMSLYHFILFGLLLAFLYHEV
jgi:hypothetical protein